MPVAVDEISKADLVEKLKAILSEKGYSQSKLAMKIGITKPGISNLLNGKYVPPWIIDTARKYLENPQQNASV